MSVFGYNAAAMQAIRAPRVIPAVAARRRPFSIGDVFTLVVPALQFAQFHAIGILFASDLLLLAALPLVLMRSVWRLRQRQIAIILMLGLAWLFAQVLTDVIRGSQPADYLRGWSKIGLTITHFAVIWILLRNSVRRFVLYGIGVCVGGALVCVTSSNPAVIGNPWKFGFSLPVTLVVILVASWLSKGRRKSLVLFALAGMACVNLILDFRSLGLICLVTGVYSYFRTRPQGQRARLGKLQVALIASAVLLSGWGFQQAYEHAAVSGWLGSKALSKYEEQHAGKGGVLLGGRSEILSSGQAILDSPIIGHGSWARDPKYKAIMRERMGELGYKEGYDDGDDLIPTHSFIFGAWVEAGIVGAFFWFWILKLVASTILRASGREPLLPVFAFIAFLLCWDILFSPYGADRRFVATYFISAILIFRSLTARMNAAKARGLQRC